MNTVAVAVVGACMRDLQMRTHREPVGGESNPATSVSSIGGVATNVARQLAHDVPTLLISATGMDDESDALQARLQLEAQHAGLLLHCRFQRFPDCLADQYVAIQTPDGRLAMGASSTSAVEGLTAAWVRTAMPQQPPPQWLVLDTNLRQETLQQLASSHQGACIGLGVSAAKIDRLGPSLDKFDVIFMNRREASVLAGKQPQAALPDVIKVLAARGLQAAVITDQQHPVTVFEQGETISLEHATAAPAATSDDRATGTDNGAGDALAAASIAGISLGESLCDSVARRGLPAAHAVVGGLNPDNPSSTHS